MYEFAVTPAVTQLRRPGVIITEVTPDSLGAELELAPHDRIIRVNGRAVRDYLDFRFQTAGETELVFKVKKPDGETLEIEFHDGDIYQYYRVPPVVHRDLLRAPSSGQYFAFFIKPSYQFNKVSG